MSNIIRKSRPWAAATLFVFGFAMLALATISADQTQRLNRGRPNASCALRTIGIRFQVDRNAAPCAPFPLTNPEEP